MPYSLDTIHPLLVHFPIALFSTGLFFDILYRIFNKEELDHAGFWTMLMALISAPFTIMSGLIAFMGQADSIRDLSEFTHAILMCTSILIFMVLFWIRIKYQLDLRYSETKRNIYSLLHILAVGMLFYAAHLGAKFAGRI